MKTSGCQNYFLLKQVISKAKRLQVNRLCVPGKPGNSWGRDGTGQHFCSPAHPELTWNCPDRPVLPNCNIFSGPDRPVI